MRRIFARLLAGLLFMVATAALAEPALGLDYIALRGPQRTQGGDGIEVIEFFWYRCPHCYALEPALESWAAHLPSDVHLRRVPVVFNKEWAIDARVFYALSAIGELARLHRSLFDAIHAQGGRRLDRQAYLDWVARWLATQGVDMRKYEQAMASSTVGAEVERAKRMTIEYQVEGTPTFAVQGRYVAAASSSDVRAVLRTTDYLVDKARHAKQAGL